MELKYDLNDIVAAAIMEKTPIVIVEGKDDRQIYQRIASKVNSNIRVYQVVEFANYAAGCEHVIEAMRVLQPKFDERPENARLILGILDRDSRAYRGTLPSGLKGIFITKYYSIETYFATRRNLAKLISKLTYTVEEDIDESVFRFVEQNIEASFPGLYLMSLEALRNTCEESYIAVIGYDSKYDAAGNKVSPLYDSNVCEEKSSAYLLSQIRPKQKDLEEFATLHSLSINHLKLIAKGKWYLYNYVYRTYPQIKKLSDECKAAHISQCRSCKVGVTQDCLFKTKRENYAIPDVYNDILEFIDERECHDIIEAFRQLA